MKIQPQTFPDLSSRHMEFDMLDSLGKVDRMTYCHPHFADGLMKILNSPRASKWKMGAYGVSLDCLSFHQSLGKSSKSSHSWDRRIIVTEKTEMQ